MGIQKSHHYGWLNFNPIGFWGPFSNVFRMMPGDEHGKLDPSVPTPLVKNCSMGIRFPHLQVVHVEVPSWFLQEPKAMAAEKPRGSKPEAHWRVARKVLLGCTYGKLVNLCGNGSPQQTASKWMESFWSAPLAVFHILSLSRIESLQLAGEIDKYMPRRQRATLAIHNMQYGGRVTHFMFLPGDLMALCIPWERRKQVLFAIS